jgi:hypothetical protein
MLLQKPYCPLRYSNNTILLPATQTPCTADYTLPACSSPHDENEGIDGTLVALGRLW